MNYIVAADTDVGIKRKVNQDSVLVEHAQYRGKQVVMAIVCDGMGGFASGELASATIINDMSQWFHKNFPAYLTNKSLQEIGNEWEQVLVETSEKIYQYALKQGEKMGSTFTGAIFYENQYVYMHVGDSRLYEITDSLAQISEDQTFMVREVKRGTMTLEEALADKRRNYLTQSVGGTKVVKPYVEVKTTKTANYLFCSDGFRHVLKEQELVKYFNKNVNTEKTLQEHARYLIELVKSRKETDNITAVLVHAM